jgi:pyruvate-formate lyase-activating enzyme
MTPAASVLQEALDLAVTATPARKPVYLASTVRAITRRGIVWLGQTCNLRCHFCYFLDRIQDGHHPEHAFMDIEKAKAICRTLVEYYGNNSIDIQGGEPTLYPQICDLVAYCAEIGLSPTIITNGQVLASRPKAAELGRAGVRDFLVSVQGLGDVYDEIVGQQGAHVRQMKALRNLQEEGIPFRFNTVLSKPALDQLGDIARLAVRVGAEVVNFLGFNPFNDQATGKRSVKNVPRYAELREPLAEALDLLADAGVEANVRYLPFCVVAPRHRSAVYDFPQIPYDLHENDFASWSWTDLPAQRMRAAPLTPPFGLGPRLELGPLRAPLRRVVVQLPLVGDGLHAIKQRLERHWAARPSGKTRDELYQEDARMRAREYTSYRHVAGCLTCDVRAICDGFYGDYADLFGEDEARPIDVDGPVSDPQHFSQHQAKRIHPDDLTWLASQDANAERSRRVP